MTSDPIPTAYDRLAAFREVDPTNVELIRDTIEAAIGEGRLDAADALVRLLQDHGDTSAAATHLSGLVAMHRGDWDVAATAFDALIADGDGAPPVAYNAAWSHMMAGRKADALARLDPAAAEALPQAAALLVTLLHDADSLIDAEQAARHLLLLHGDHRGLNAAVSKLAIDIEDIALAAATAAVAGDHPDAITTRATLLLEDDPAAARLLFDQALHRAPDSPRALMGRGMAQLAGGYGDGAIADLDRGAEGFGSHLGSWLAAGWAHLIAGDAVTAAARFETALAIDPNFAESHGSLAVIDLRAGRVDDARRRIDVARRLDRESFSAALAQSLLATAGGDAHAARRILATALDTPLDDSGVTLSQALARMAR